MKKDSGGNRHQLMMSAGAWALLVGLLIAAATGWAGFNTTEVLETAAFGAFGAAICILFFCRRHFDICRASIEARSSTLKRASLNVKTIAI